MSLKYDNYCVYFSELSKIILIFKYLYFANSITGVRYSSKVSTSRGSSKCNTVNIKHAKKKRFPSKWFTYYFISILKKCIAINNLFPTVKMVAERGL